MTEQNQFVHSNIIQLNQPLVIDPERFRQGYEYPIESLVESRPGGGGSEVKYMSYTHTIRIFKELFPELAAECVVNPVTGSYLFQEPGNRGYFMKSYVHDGTRCSSIFYFGILDTSMAPVFPDQASTQKDWKTKSVNVRTFTNLAGEIQAIPALNSQLLNKCYYRALCKAIAFSTGIGLKLWTGDDLTDSEEPAVPTTSLPSKKERMIEGIKNLAAKYNELTGLSFDVSTEDKDEAELAILGKKLKAMVDDATAVPPSVPLNESETTVVAVENETAQNDVVDTVKSSATSTRRRGAKGA